MSSKKRINITLSDEGHETLESISLALAGLDKSAVIELLLKNVKEIGLTINVLKGDKNE